MQRHTAVGAPDSYYSSRSTIFVAGHNNTAPEIVKALGGGDYPVIPENEYDNMFIVTIYRFGKAKVVKIKYGGQSAGGGNNTMVPK